MDIKAFTSDLQGYYHKIHGDIAQLKGILAAVKRKQNKQYMEDTINVREMALFTAAMSGDEQPGDTAARQAYGVSSPSKPFNATQKAAKADE